MRLDPDRELAPATVEAILDLFEPSVLPGTDDALLLRVALGVADDGARLAYAQAALASPAVRLRLLRLRACVREGLAERGPDNGALSDLSLLAAFPGPFRPEDAARAFPQRFAEREGLERLAARGWLDEAAGGWMSLPERVRALVPALPEDGWAAAYIGAMETRLEAIGRLLAEGRWAEGSGELSRELPNFRAAWGHAERLGESGTVERLARSLVPSLMEMGEAEALADLLASGYRASEVLDEPRLRQWLLSYEGAAASYRGESDIARGLWTERLGLCQHHGIRPSEVDALLDLAAQAQGDGDLAECRRLLAEAEPIASEIGRTDFLASVWSLRALLALDEGDPDEALTCAGSAARALAGRGEARVGLFVRLTVARTLARCGGTEAALEALVDALERSMEEGRAVDAASALVEIGRILEPGGRAVLAGLCFATAVGVRRALGARRLAATESDLAEFVGRHPGDEATIPTFDGWHAAAQAVLADLRHMRLAASR